MHQSGRRLREDLVLGTRKGIGIERLKGLPVLSRWPRQDRNLGEF